VRFRRSLVGSHYSHPTRMSPTTCSVVAGEVVPIPNCPVEVSRMAMLLFVAPVGVMRKSIYVLVLVGPTQFSLSAKAIDALPLVQPPLLVVP